MILRCLRCNREWCSRSDDPRRCGKCKSPYWDREKVLDEASVSVESRGVYDSSGREGSKAKIKTRQKGGGGSEVDRDTGERYSGSGVAVEVATGKEEGTGGASQEPELEAVEPELSDEDIPAAEELESTGERSHIPWNTKGTAMLEAILRASKAQEKPEDQPDVPVCGFETFNGEDGENYRCQLPAHGIKVKHGKWLKV